MKKIIRRRCPNCHHSSAMTICGLWFHYRRDSIATTMKCRFRGCKCEDAEGVKK